MRLSPVHLPVYRIRSTGVQIRALKFPPGAPLIMEPITHSIADTIGGQTVWRFDVAPKNPDAPIEQITLWFAEDASRLHRARTIFRGPQNDVEIISRQWTKVFIRNLDLVLVIGLIYSAIL